MDLGLSEQQEMLRRTAREFLEAECPTTLVRELEESERGYSPELWQRMADLGWLGLAFPTEYGGANASIVDQVLLFEEIGRAIVPSPILTSTVLSGQTILNAGTQEQKARLLPGLARGDIIATLALRHAGNGFREDDLEAHALAATSDYVVNGVKLFVPYANVSDYLLCVAETPLLQPTQFEKDPRSTATSPSAEAATGATLFIVDSSSPGVTITLMDSVAKYKQHEVRFRDVRVPNQNVVGAVAQGQDSLATAIGWATVVQCSEMVGRAQKVLDMVVEYSKVRVQFGRPIGSFQAIQHRCADLRVAVDGARLVTYQAAWKLMEGLPCSEDVSMAKAVAGSVSRQAHVAGHSIFAGIAFTVEHDMQLYTMRSKIAEANLGDTDFHLERLGEYLNR